MSEAHNEAVLKHPDRFPQHTSACKTRKEDCPWCREPWEALMRGYNICGKQCHQDKDAKPQLIPQFLPRQ